MNDFYDSVNADVIRNKQIQKSTGMSPAQEKHKILNDPSYKSPLFQPVKAGWKKGWRIILSASVIEDYSNQLPIPKYYQLAHRDFDTASNHYFPLGIAQLVALGYWLYYHSYRLVKNLRSWETTERQHKRELENAFNDGYKEGREFEFRTMREGIAAEIEHEVSARFARAIQLSKGNQE